MRKKMQYSKDNLNTNISCNIKINNKKITVFFFNFLSLYFLFHSLFIISHLSDYAFMLKQKTNEK